jgi:alkanesulfonate monooxygenase SsuD/methylene tetrahydromethanopterin reductase-like flavin-dependent oxidoreductase (luciferase family)
METRATQVGLFTLGDHLPDPSSGVRTSVSQRLADIIEQGALAEAAGFERFGVGEHHFCDYIVPNPSLVLAAIAARSSRIKLFTCVTLIACRDAVQVSEDIAILDHISRGRLEICFARGVSRETAEVFGVDGGNVQGVMADRLAIVLSLFRRGTLPPAAEGREPLRLVPTPWSSPHPPLWIGSGVTPESCELAFSNGLGLFLPSLLRSPEEYLPTIERYRDGMAGGGHGERARVGLPSYCWVAKTSQLARQTFRPRLEAYANYAQTLRGGFRLGAEFETLIRGPAICGSPAEVADRIAALNERLGLDYHILSMDVGGAPMAELREAIELMGSEVVPQFRGQA